MALIRTEAVKQRIARKSNDKVVGQKFNDGNLVLQRADKHWIKGKLAPNWDGPFRVIKNLGNGAYQLSELSGKEVSLAWNVAKLRKYFS